MKKLVICIIIFGAFFSKSPAREPAPVSQSDGIDCQDLSRTCEKCGLSINLVCRYNGKGIEADGKVLEDSLRALGCTVNRYRGKEESGIAFSDVNIFCEHIVPHFLPHARQNWFIPNPEILNKGRHFLDSIDLILCRTKEVERIFQELGKETYFLGFTTPEALRPHINKDFTLFIHVGGASPFKGTYPIANAWRRNPHFPSLTVVSTMEPIEGLPDNLEWLRERLPLEELRCRQNRCGVHLCLSDTEGFGHYLMEALSCGAVVVATDAPPMNEFVQDSRFLVPYSYTRKKQLATRYFVTPETIEAKVSEILNLTEEELETVGRNNRVFYIEKDLQFKENLKTLIEHSHSFAFPESL